MKRIVMLMMVLAWCGSMRPAVAADPTGTWTSTLTHNGQNIESTLILRLDSEGNWLSGAERSGRRDPDVPIANASLKGNKLAFSVTHEFNGQKIIAKYSGTVGGDTIAGRSFIDYGDRTQSADWVAKRQN